MSEKTGEQMASEDPRLQEMIRRAARDAAYDLTLAFTLGAEAGVRWSAERIAVVGACETEPKPCGQCNGHGAVTIINDSQPPYKQTCYHCGGTGKAKE